MIVTLYIVTEDKTQITANTTGTGGYGGYYGYGPGYGWGGGHSTTTYSEYDYTVGTLVIAVYDEAPEFGRNIAIYTSKDLKKWTHESNIPGYFECAEIFELPVDGDDSKTKWVIFAAAGWLIGIGGHAGW